MALLVKYVNNGIGYIPNYELNTLIESGKIVKFKRSDGEWVDPKTGPLRGSAGRTSYNGPERRARFNNFNPFSMAGMILP